jgi:hypothetical protein
MIDPDLGTALRTAAGGEMRHPPDPPAEVLDLRTATHETAVRCRDGEAKARVDRPARVPAKRRPGRR